MLGKVKKKQNTGFVLKMRRNKTANIQATLTRAIYLFSHGSEVPWGNTSAPQG